MVNVDDDTSVFGGDIDRLAAARITRGCNPPDNSGSGVFRNIDGRWCVVTMFTGTTNKTTCLDAGFTTWSACDSSPDSNRYFGNKMWGPPLLNTAESNYGFDDFWRAVFS